jgi:hypothetical protein
MSSVALKVFAVLHCPPRDLPAHLPTVPTGPVSEAAPPQFLVLAVSLAPLHVPSAQQSKAVGAVQVLR